MTLLDKGKQIPKKNTAHLPIMKQKSTYYKTEMNRNELFYLLVGPHHHVLEVGPAGGTTAPRPRGGTRAKRSMTI